MKSFAPKTSFAFSKAKAVTSPPEKVTIIVYQSQIVQLMLPHQTPRAKEIRETISCKVLNEDNTKIFYYDPDDSSWSNLHYKSTRAVPLLAAPPADACEKAYTVLKACPAVASVAINDENGEPLTLDEVAEAVLALQDKTAQQEQDVDSLKGKLTRAE